MTDDAEPRPATVALCGAGMISGAHAAAATLLEMPIVGVASRTPARALERARQLHTVALSYAELPAGADIVIVSTPPQRHAADTLAMLAGGAAVVVEKPLCTTLVDADALVAATQANDQRVLYAENLAYAPVVTALLGLAPSIGPLTHLEVRTIQTIPAWGAFTSDAWGGGALFDLGVHPLALAVLAAGASGAGPVTSVRATLTGGEGHDTDEHADVHLTFRNGAVGHVVSSWQATSAPVWDLQMSSDTEVLRIDFWPSASLEHNGHPVEFAASTNDGSSLIELGYAEQLRAFREDLATHSTPFMDVAFGRMILEIVCAAYRSAGLGGNDQPLPFSGDRTMTPLQLWRGSAAVRST
ncbi:MAG: Gfo/Idh/MocA family oxidoreductase [Ilumatobacteraceae bacterium]